MVSHIIRPDHIVRPRKAKEGNVCYHSQIVKRLTGKSSRFAQCLLALAAAFWTAAAPADVLDDIGYTALAARISLSGGGGGGIPVAQVEGLPAGSSAYAPDLTAPALAGKTFTLMSGNSGVSPHAGLVAGSYYGSGSPGRGVTKISLYSSNGLFDNVLKVGQTTQAPAAISGMVVNNSWVASYAKEANNIDAVRRFDDQINRDDLLAFTAVDNTPTTGFPKLLASSYNTMTVGNLTGSAGPVLFDGVSRIKPDIAVNTGQTSVSCALAAGSGALLRSQAGRHHLGASELAIKTIMMAGAQRGASWKRGGPSGKDNATAPLDFQQGAGLLRVDRANDILLAGQQSVEAAIRPAAGWDYARVARTSNDAAYQFHLSQAVPEWSAILGWNRTIAGLHNGKYDSTPNLADFALSLLQLRRGRYRDYFTCDAPGGNVESLTLTNLPAGDYEMVLEANVRSYYALAWYAGTDSAGGVAAAVPMVARASVDSSPMEMTGQGLTVMSVPEPPLLLMGIPIFALFCYWRPERGK